MIKQIDQINIHGEILGGSCGYCKNNSENIKFGCTCSDMSTETYQLLMDRGWRRCGSFYYKPNNQRTCCPMYPIRCETSNIILKKSHKKVLKNFNNFLKHGNKPKQVLNNIKTTVTARGDESDLLTNIKVETNSKNINKDRISKSKFKRFNKTLEKLRIQSQKRNIDYEILYQAYLVRRKIRLSKNKEKSLAELLNNKAINFTNKLEIKTIKCDLNSREYQNTLLEEHEVYVKYQTKIHHDKPSKVTLDQYKRFLVEKGLKSSDSPVIVNTKICDGKFPQGQYHQQYFLNGVIIAVGVIDILPYSLSSVYLFYDPEYSFLNLGVYSALQEINFVNSLSNLYQKSDFKYYYMGYYIHSCPKMKYKGQYHGSELACSETYNWVPIAKCQELLDKSKYARFSDENSVDPYSVSQLTISELSKIIIVNFRGRDVPLKQVLKLLRNSSMFKELGILVGSKVLDRISVFVG